METVLSGCLTVILWASSITVLLPFWILFKYNVLFREKLFSHIFMLCLNIFIKPKLIPMRKKAFDFLNQKLSGRDVTNPLKVLEIGIASGPNLQFYPENSYLTALDIDAKFESHLKQNVKKYSQVVCEKTVVSAAENMKDINDCSMDLVISVYVLCSITNLKDVLKEIKRVLKPVSIPLKNSVEMLC